MNQSQEVLSFTDGSLTLIVKNRNVEMNINVAKCRNGSSAVEMYIMLDLHHVRAVVAGYR